ncbi:MAG: glycosyltransferase [Clostridium sp.]|nr:glycosyltransferase [Clostridium sp.]
MKPIRVLQVMGSLNSGGSQSLVMNLYRNIDRSKVQFDFVIDKNNELFYQKEIESMGGIIYQLKNIKECSFTKYCKQWNEFFSNHSEYLIIHGHLRSTAAIYLKIAKKRGLITIAHSHSTASRGNKIECMVKNIMQIPIRYIADYLFACSYDSGRWLYGKKAIKNENFVIINNSIDSCEYLYDENKRNELRRKLNLESKYVIGHVGSFTYPKNHEFLINIFYEIQKSNKDTVLLLIGDGELKKNIVEQVYRLKINDKVIFTGVVSNVKDYMQIMDVFVFPSIFEGLPVTLIEAQAMGLPCIISNKITSEVILTSLVKVLGLNNTSDWTSLILHTKVSENRKSYNELIKNSQYDIDKSTLWIQNFYIEQFKNKIDNGESKEIYKH